MEKQGIPSGNLISLSLHSVTILTTSLFCLSLQEEKQTTIDTATIKRCILTLYFYLPLQMKQYFLNKQG
jgi:hypothetical protein